MRSTPADRGTRLPDHEEAHRRAQRCLCYLHQSHHYPEEAHGDRPELALREGHRAAEVDALALYLRDEAGREDQRDVEIAGLERGEVQRRGLGPVDDLPGIDDREAQVRLPGQRPVVEGADGDRVGPADARAGGEDLLDLRLDGLQVDPQPKRRCWSRARGRRRPAIGPATIRRIRISTMMDAVLNAYLPARIPFNSRLSAKSGAIRL